MKQQPFHRLPDADKQARLDPVPEFYFRKLGISTSPVPSLPTQPNLLRIGRSMHHELGSLDIDMTGCQCQDQVGIAIPVVVRGGDMGDVDPAAGQGRYWFV